ncbi:MAG TPA: ABC transporter permease [Gammaproteobacteria bacterium]|nr:ABC transporter permease [Gammaproteobacteria bacterium]
MLGHYLAIALRNLRRAPFTAAINVATLALGLVAFVAAYAVVMYWNHSDRHFANADRTYVVTASLALRDGSISTGTMPATNELYAKYLKVDFPELEAIVRANPWNQQASITADGRGARVVAVAVDPEFLDIFDLPFVAGDPRTALASPDGLLVTEAAALRLFGTKDALGKTISLGGNLIDATVKGVIGPIPEPSHIGNSRSASLHFDIMAPYALYERLREAVNRPPPGARAQGATQAPPGAAPAANAQASNGGAQPARGNDANTNREGSAAADAPPADAPPPPQNENWLGGYCCTTYAMLKRGSSLTTSALNARLRDFAAHRMSPEQLKLASVDVGAVPLSGLMVTNLDAQLLGGSRGLISITTVLFGLGALVLLVACVNYANLATARAVRRAREIGLRKVIGARRVQLVAQYLLEAGVLTAAALAVAVGIVALLARPVYDAVGVDMRTATLGDPGFWLFVAALLVIVTLLGGAYPALVLSRVRPIEALRIGRVRLGPRFASTVLVGAQFTVASFLLIAVMIVNAQNSALARTGLGTTRDQHLMINNFRPVTGVASDLLRAEIERLPQVKSVTQMGAMPWGDNVNLQLLSRSPEETASPQTTFQNNVGYDFFATLDIPLLAGRVFDREHADLPPENVDQNDRNAARPTINIVIDRVLAKQLGFGSPSEAVDQTIYFPGVLGQRAQPFRVIGVVESHPLFFRGLGATSNVYQLSGPNLQNFIVRIGAGDISGGVAGIEAAWNRLGARVPIQRRFMDEAFNEGFEKYARLNQVFVGLTGVAFFISIIGLFGMAVQVAGRRTHEIGVRKSVGARKWQVVLMLLRDFSKPVLVANLIAWPLAYFAAQPYLHVFIQRVSLTPLPFVASLVIVLLIAWAAVGSQAWRAARANPATVLRFE